MNNKDIRQEILYQLDNIDDVENLCKVDKTFKNLCQKEFWIHWYNKHQLGFPNNTYNDINDYINEYKLIEKATDLFNYLYNNLDHILVFSYVIKDDFLFFNKSFINENFNKPIQVEMIKHYIYYVPDGPQSIEKVTVSDKQMYDFIFKVLSAGIEIKKDVY